MYPSARVASGRHPAAVSCVAGRPGGCAVGPQRGQPVRGRWAGRLRSIPRLRASLAAYLSGVALGSGAHSHGPLPALLRRGPGGSGSSAAGPGSSWASRSAEGAAPVSPARQSGPPWRGRRLCVRPGSPRGAPARGGLAALLTGGRVSEARRTATPPPLRGAPSPPAALLTDGATAPTRRRRGSSQLLSLMLGLLRIPRGARGGGDTP